MGNSSKPYIVTSSGIRKCSVTIKEVWIVTSRNEGIAALLAVHKGKLMKSSHLFKQ